MPEQPEKTGTYVRPQDAQVPKQVIDLLPRNACERYRVCPVGMSETRSGLRVMTIASVDASNLMLADQLQQLTGCRITLVPAYDQDIMRGIDVHYTTTHTSAPTDLLNQMGSIEPAAPMPAVAAAARNGNSDETRNVSAMVQDVLQRAITERASDIHIEPHAKQVYVRFRIDGVMYDHNSYDVASHTQVISRLKILSNLDIAQNRMPQDGRFEVSYANKEFDIRLSFVPATHGEKAVLRLLPKGHVMTDFKQLGLEGNNFKLLEEAISRPFGMVLATGPTGSGKTTTVYACLASMDCVGKNVITVEDPVEYQFPRITQIQVHPRIGLTFAVGLRAILRQDPDVILVGEIRDLETLQIAIQSALTGHMVLSTLHCNDGAAGAARMVDMGAEPFLVASALNAIMAQRLVRRVCEKCRTEAQVTDVVRQKLNLPDDGAKYVMGKGCGHCRGTGYYGRVSVFEIIPVVEPIQQAIVKKSPASEIRQIIRDCGFATLHDDALAKARAGITSLEEMMRAVYVEDYI